MKSENEKLVTSVEPYSDANTSVHDANDFSDLSPISKKQVAEAQNRKQSSDL